MVKGSWFRVEGLSCRVCLAGVRIAADAGEAQDKHDHRLRPPAGVVVLLGSRFLSHTTRS